MVKNTQLDYKRELELAAKSMILVHNPETLIRMIVRTIVQKVQVKHAGILLYNKDRNSYVLTVSGGERGLRIPKGFARVDPHSPLIRLFTLKNKELASTSDGILISNKIDHIIWKNNLIKAKDDYRELLEQVKEQLATFDAVTCIPAYFHNSLLAILLLGEKVNKEEFHKDELDFFSALASDVAMAIRNAQVFEDLQIEVKINRELFINTTRALAAAIDAKDHYTKGHTERVTQFSILIAEKLGTYEEVKLSRTFLENLHVASLLHDIGKIAVPEYILNKPGKLTDYEFAKIKEHPGRGVKILEHIKELKEAILGVKYHHEKYDGTGYPEGLHGENIPLIAAVIAVADVYDAMTTDRPYRKAIPRDEVIEEINKSSGSHFNPTVVRAFVELCGEGKI